ncbi:MAG: hypothetical protein GWP09_03220, partial [Nitrospiraceae bacterium]|nr:hypothetical protein [Nitrospiraceae bacterium]
MNKYLEIFIEVFVILIIVFFLLYFLKPSDSNYFEISRCRTISRSGIYTVTNNLSFNGNSSCIDIRADDVIVDCNNQLISNPQLPSYPKVSNSAFLIDKSNNVTLKNCRIIRFVTGISVNNSYNVSIENARISNNVNGVHIHKHSRYVVISDSYFSDNNKSIIEDENAANNSLINSYLFNNSVGIFYNHYYKCHFVFFGGPSCHPIGTKMRLVNDSFENNKKDYGNSSFDVFLEPNFDLSGLDNLKYVIYMFYAIIILVIFSCFFLSLTLYKIAKKLNRHRSWLIWIPVVNMFYIPVIAGYKWQYGFLWFFPISVCFLSYLSFAFDSLFPSNEIISMLIFYFFIVFCFVGVVL